MNKLATFVSHSICALLSLIIAITIWMLILYNIVNVKVETALPFWDFMSLLIKTNAAYAMLLTFISIIGLRSAIKIDRINNESAN